MPTASGSIAYLGAARFQGYWNASNNDATGSGLPGAAAGAFSTLLVNGGYHSSTNLTASAGDYWQITGSGTTTIDGQSVWALNDWCIYSSSAGGSGTWLRLAFEDTISSVIVGDLSASDTFNLTGSSNKQVLFITGASDSDVVMSGSNNFTFDYDSNDLSLTGNIKISDDKKIYLGSDHDAHIEYNEDGDNFLVISGSAAGLALSGSTVSINGNLLLSVSTLGAPSTSQDSFYVLDATDGAIKTTTIDATLGAIVADDGGLARAGSQLLISGSNIATAAVAVSADEVLMLDADGTIKRETFVDLASAMAASNGGLVASSGALLLSGSNLADAAVATTDEFIFIDADGSVKRDSITDLLTAISGDGLDVASEQLKVNLSEVIANDGNNRLLTSDGDGTATAESSLTYDGATFNVHDDLDITGSLSGQLSGSVEFKINMKHNNTGQFSDQSGNQFLYLVPSGVTRGPAINAVGGGNSGLGFATSGSSKARIFHDEEGNKDLVISGSGLALTGSTVGINGTLQLSDASGLTASNGGLVASGGTLLVSGSNIADDAIDPSGDELIFLTTGSIKRESVDDFVTAIAGDPGKGLRNAGDGTLELYFAEISAINDSLALQDSVMILDNGSQTKRATMSQLGAYLAGTGLTSSFGILSASAADNEKIYFGTDNDAFVEYNEDGDEFLVISGSSAGTALSGSVVRVADKLSVGRSSGIVTGSSKTSGILVVDAAAADTQQGTIATFRSADADYSRVNIDNSTSTGDTQFTFMSNGASKWSIGNMGSNATFHIKSGFGDFADTDPFILTTTTGLTFNTSFTSSVGGLIPDDQKLYFGDSEESHIEYNENGDSLLVISGSSAGMVLSGSTIDIGGFGNGSTITKLNGKVGVNDFDPKVVFSTTSNYQLVTFENQLSDGEGGGERLIYSPGANDTLTAGQIYFLHTDGTWDQADGSAMSTGGTQLIAVGFAGSSQQVGVLLRGFVRIPSTEILNVPGSGAVDGLPVYVSTTAGHFDFTPPSSSGEFVRVVGHAIDDDGGDVLVYFNPSPLGAANP